MVTFTSQIDLIITVFEDKLTNIVEQNGPVCVKCRLIGEKLICISSHNLLLPINTTLGTSGHLQVQVYAENLVSMSKYGFI